jgi:hypothetical protein
MKIEALPVGLKFSIAGIKFYTNVQYDIYGEVSIFIFNDNNETIAVLDNKNAENVIAILNNYIKKETNSYNYFKEEAPKTVKKIINNLAAEIKAYNKNKNMPKTTKKKTTKKPSPAQLAARKKFVAMVKNKAKTAKAKKAPAKKKAAVKKATATKAYQTGSSNKLYDSIRKAQGPGKRVSATGGVYYERRKNRSDMPGSILGIDTKTKFYL